MSEITWDKCKENYIADVSVSTLRFYNENKIEINLLQPTKCLYEKCYPSKLNDKLTLFDEIDWKLQVRINVISKNVVPEGLVCLLC